MRQKITLPTRIPSKYIGSPGVAIWYVYLNGTDVSLDHDLAVSLAKDEIDGSVFVSVEVNAVLRSKYAFGSIGHELKVNCPAFIIFGNQNVSNIIQECTGI